MPRPRVNIPELYRASCASSSPILNWYANFKRSQGAEPPKRPCVTTTGTASLSTRRRTANTPRRKSRRSLAVDRFEHARCHQRQIVRLRLAGQLVMDVGENRVEQRGAAL